MALPIYRAMSYGPKSPGATSADMRQIYGGTLNGQKIRLQSGDLAISPNLLSQFPMGSLVDVVDPSTGQVLRSGVRVADTSWIKEGQPTSNSFELYNDQDLGHASLVAHGGSSDTSATTSSASTDSSPGPSYLGDGTTPTSSTVPASQWGSPLLDQIRQLQVAQALRNPQQAGAILERPGVQSGSQIGAQAGRQLAQILQGLQRSNPYMFSSGAGAYQAGLGQADPFGAGGSFDVTA